MAVVRDYSTKYNPESFSSNNTKKTSPTTTNEKEGGGEGATKSYPITEWCSGYILSAFEPTVRPTDVFVVTSAKCGQTWITTLLFHLKNKCSQKGRDLIRNEGLMKCVPWLEIPLDLMRTNDDNKEEEGAEEKDAFLYDVQERIDELTKLSNPRIFKMHTLYETVPITTQQQQQHSSNTTKGGPKLIIVSRDPRDVPYSMYKHFQGLKGNGVGPFAHYDEEIPSFEEYYTTNWKINNFYFRHLNSFWNHKHDVNVHWIKYEDLKLNTMDTIQKLVNFLEWNNDTSNEDIETAIRLSSFQNMKNDEQDESTQFLKGYPKNFVREGEIGKNCSRLSMELEKDLLKLLKEKCPPDAVDFVLSQEVTKNSIDYRKQQRQRSNE